MQRSVTAKVSALLLSSLLVLTSLSGCNNTNQKNAETTTRESTQTTQAKTTPSGPEPITLPIAAQPITLTMFCGLDAKASATITNLNEMISFKEFEKRTGIHIDFKHPTAGQETQQLNLTIASGDLPDMMYTGWSSIPGGPEKAVKDGVIQPLNDLIAKYAPNLTKLLNDDPQLKKDSVTDAGTFYMMPFMRYEKIMRFFDGYQIRKDWLDKLGMKVPLTVDEWYAMLKAFKEKDPNGNGKADEIPFIARGADGITPFATAWGLGYVASGVSGSGFYLEGGKVKYGPAQPQYKNFLTTMNKWYVEGLIDKDFLTTDAKNFDAKVMNSIGGAYYGKLNGDMGKYMGLMPSKEPKFDLCSAVINAPDGKSYNFNSGAASAVSGDGMAISPKSKYQKEAMKWLDYCYSEPGRLLNSFGIEGVTYTMVNGQPKYTDLIMKNPQGLSFDQALSHYCPGSIKPRMYQDPRYWDQAMISQGQREGNKFLMDKSTLEKTLPTAITPTQDEAKSLSSVINELSTYVNEMTTKFIIGQQSLDGFDKFVENLKSLKLDDATSIQQKAYDRYQARK